MKLNVIKQDPYFGFPIDNDNALQVYKAIHDKGYRCITKYVGSKHSLTVQCKRGHHFSGYPRKITIQCDNCPTCWKNNNVSPSEKISQIITVRNGVQKSPYVRSNLKIQTQCSNGHNFEIRSDDLINGIWCGKCAGNDIDE